MKIVIFDPYLGKFTKGMHDYWVAQGHEVLMDRYYDPQKVLWADVVWFDTADNNLKSATNPSEAIMDDAANFQPWDMHLMDLSQKKIIVRAIDIEIWYGHQNGSIWDVVDHCICIAPHIQELIAPCLPGTVKQHIIPCAVDLERYEFKERDHGNVIAIVSEKWTSKGTDLILQIALELKDQGYDYHFKWLGRWSDYEWEKAYFEDFIRYHELDFEFTEWIEGDNAVDEFLEGANYLLHASHKEGFSYAVAEAMAKGIKPILHRFYGADALWPNITWNSISEAIDEMDMQYSDYESEYYRQYLIDRGYTLPQMMKKIQEVIDA